MNTTPFDTYWREFGKLEHEVIKNRPDLEEDFRNLAKKVWETAYNQGFNDAPTPCSNDY